MMRVSRLCLSLTCLIVFLTAHGQQTGAPSNDELTAALAAKVLASGIFVSQRTQADVLEQNVHRMIALFGYQPGDISQVKVDRDKGVVTLQIKEALPRSARFYGDQGCVVMPRSDSRIHFTQTEVAPVDHSSRPWPTGDQIGGDAELPDGLDRQQIDQAVEAAFTESSDTAGLVVVHNGRIIAEKYGAGADREMPLESWSMGKSLIAILYARALYLDGKKFDPFVPAPVAQWQADDDDRARIQIADLFRMSSGLKFSHPSSDQPDKWDHGHPDHFYVYSGAIDVFEFSRSRPLEHSPGTVGRYRNCDPLIIGSITRSMIEADGGDYHAFPQRELFDKIGIRNITLEPDPYGNFISTGYEYGTARDWARLGLLVLQDGVWEGERLLPEGFTEFVSTPAPAWPRGEYGGLFWTNANHRWNLPESAYYMAGHGTQHVLIVPTHNLVIVRMGHQRGGGPGARALNKSLELLMKGIPLSTD